MAAFLRLLEGPAAAEQQSAVAAACTGNSSSRKICVVANVVAALGSRSTSRRSSSSSRRDVVADVLQLLLLERLEGEAAAAGSSSSSSDRSNRQPLSRLRESLISLIAHITDTAATAAATAAVAAADTTEAASARDDACRICSLDDHLFGVLLLLSCPQPWAAARCCLACRAPPGVFLLLQADCLTEAVSRIGEAARPFVRAAATHLLLLLQQQDQQPQLRLLQQRQQQLLLLRAAACLIDMYDPSLLEDCSRELQREGRGRDSDSLLMQRIPYYKQLLLQRLFSVSLQQRQTAAAALRQLLNLPPSQGSDPVGDSMRLWRQTGKKEMLMFRVCGLPWEEGEVSVLCAAAANSRLSPSTRAQSLQTLLVYVHSSAGAALPFLRRLSVEFLQAVRLQQDAAAAAAVAVQEISIGAGTDAPEKSFLLSLVELLRASSLQQQQQQQQEQQQRLLTTVAQALAMPLLLLPPGDALLHPLIRVYIHLLADSLVLQCLSPLSPSVALSCLQLCALLLFHPQQTLLLQHRVCPLGSEWELLLLTQQQHQQQQQQQQQQELLPSLLLPGWLSLRVELPLETQTIDVPTAAQAAWAQRSEDAAFLVARQVYGEPAVLEAAAAAAAAVAAFRRVYPQLLPPSDREATQGTQHPDSSGSSSCLLLLPARRRLAAAAAAAGAGDCCICSSASHSLCVEYPALSLPPGSNFLSFIGEDRVCLSRQMAQRLVNPTYPELRQLLEVLCSPPLPLLPGALPVRRQPQQAFGSPSLFPAAAALPAAAAAAAADVAGYTEALQCCRKIVAALHLPGEFAAVCCCLLGQEHAAATAAAAPCCCCGGRCLSVPAANGLRALALALKRYVYPFLQQLSQQVAEAMLESQEAAAATAAAAAAGDGLLQQPVGGNEAGDCRREIDLLLLGTQLLVELLPLAAAAAPAPAAEPGSSSGSEGDCCLMDCCSCSGWLALPNVSQFCGSLLGVSTQLPLLRRMALQLTVLTLRHSLPPPTWSNSSKMSLLSLPGDQLWMQEPMAFPESSSSNKGTSEQSSNSSVLLQLQLQQLLQLACRLSPDEGLSLQEQQSLSHALVCMRVCVRHNAFAAVAAAAAEAAAEWQLTAAAAAAESLMQQQVLLEGQLALLLGYLTFAHPEVRVAAWRCLRACLLSGEAGLLQRLQQQQQQGLREELLLRLYASICPAACQRVLDRHGPLPGGFCSSCPSSLTEAAEALRCLSALRCCSSSSAAAEALDEWTASESFVHRILGGFLSCNGRGNSSSDSSNSSNSSNDSSSSSSSLVDEKTAMRGLTAALELLCWAAKTHAKALQRMLQQQQQQQPSFLSSNSSNSSSSSAGCCSGSTLLTSIIDSVCPRRRPQVLLPSANPAAATPTAANAEVAAAAAAAVAAVGTEEAGAAFAAAAAVLRGSRCKIREIRKSCRALQLLLGLAEATDSLSICLGSSDSSNSSSSNSSSGHAAVVAAADNYSGTATAAAADGDCYFPLFPYVEELVKATALLLLLPSTKRAARSQHPSSSSSSSSRTNSSCCTLNRDTAAAATLGARWRQETAEVVREVLLLLLRLFALLHPQTALQVGEQLQGETSVLLLLRQREELQQQQQQQRHVRQQAPLDKELLQTLQQGTQQQRWKAAAAATAAAQQAIQGIWSSPSLWLLLVCCLQVLRLPQFSSSRSSFFFFCWSLSHADCCLFLLIYFCFLFAFV